MRTAEDKKEYARLYREKNKHKINEWHKKNYLLNKDKKKKYAIEKSENIKMYRKEYYTLNSENIKNNAKQYYNNNKENIKISKAKYCKYKRLNDSSFKFRNNVSKLIGNAIRESGNKKISKTIEILGCSIEQFKLHLESQFESWMNWDNYGNPKDGIFELNKTWDIDHIIPLKTAKTVEDIIRLNHYTNLQPLCSYYNRWVKKDNIIV